MKKQPIDPEPETDDPGNHEEDYDESEHTNVATDSHLVETDAGT